MNPFYSYPQTDQNNNNTTSSSNIPEQQPQLPYPTYSTASQPAQTGIPQPPPIIPVQQPIQQSSQATTSYQQPIDPTNPQPIGSTVPVEHKQKQATAPPANVGGPSTTQNPSHVEHHYHVVFSPDNPPPLTAQPPVEPRDWDNYYDEASGASSSLSLSICLSILLACVGCFPLSCIPYWFVYSTYKYSANRKAQSVSAIAKTLFWLTVMMNVCFCCISVFIIVIVPPSVVVPKYY